MIHATVNVSAIVADLCTRCRWPYHIRVGCYGSDVTVVRLLLEKGADVNICDKVRS